MWAGLLLTLPVVLYSAAPFFRGAARELSHARPGMDVPVALGILIPLSFSGYYLYLSAEALILGLIVLSRYAKGSGYSNAM